LDEAIKALEEFVTAAEKLNAIWEDHLGKPVDRALCDNYPERWKDFDSMVFDANLWLSNLKEAEHG
jgi:hypothetical protein